MKEHKFKHNLQVDSEDSVDPLCSCGNDMEAAVHFFLHCPTFSNQRQTLLNKLKGINASIMAKMKIQLSERSYMEYQALTFQLTKKLLMHTLGSF